jgi:hypothetical protein
MLELTGWIHAYLKLDDSCFNIKIFNTNFSSPNFLLTLLEKTILFLSCLRFYDGDDKTIEFLKIDRPLDGLSRRREDLNLRNPLGVNLISSEAH